VVLTDLREVLPVELLSRAHHAESGDLSWTAGDALEVARFVSASGFAVVGGEKYDLFPGAYWGTFSGAFSIASLDELAELLDEERAERHRRYWLSVVPADDGQTEPEE
jgi:hypothetical protein